MIARLGRALLVPAAAVAASVALVTPGAMAATPASAVIKVVAGTVHVHRVADMYSTVTSRIISTHGASVTVGCYERYATASGLWYRVTVPAMHAGFISAAVTNYPHALPPGVPSCRAWTGTFQTRAPSVNVRTAPHTNAHRVGTLPARGTNVAIVCWIKGEAVSGDDIWYLTVHPLNGFIAGHELTTGRDPVAGAPSC